MLSQAKSQTEIASHRKKLTNSYKELLDEFSSQDLRHVGNYTLGRLLGKGSFGKVYLATHNLTNGSKVVLKSAKKDDQNLAREIHHHRQFVHPHIARLYEVIVTENLVWLVLEYCPGDELYNHLLQNGPIDPSKVQKLFTQLVGAVSYIHNKSCVHRDLKLENVLLDKHENVKLVDFGFTREYEGKANYLQTWCGTVCYSAPEMLKGEKYAGEKVDVWSLGIILYALLAGELPFDDDDETITKTRILKEDPKYPDSYPLAAKELTAQLLSKRPLLRPSLADILQNPWLSEHAPTQQAILKVQQPAPFSTELEKETLHRMRSAGVDIDKVIENVLSQRCDGLAGWWALLIEKEERKAKRREQKRKEREAEIKSIRRSSAASSRLERMAPTIREADEDSNTNVILLKDPPRPRGRPMKRLSSNYNPPDLPLLLETQAGMDMDNPPPPVEKDSVRSASSSRSRRPVPPPKENRRSRGSMLQVVQTNPELLGPNVYVPNRRRKHHPLLSQWISLRNWFKDSTKRARSPNSKASSTTSPKLPQGNQTDGRAGSHSSQSHGQEPGSTENAGTPDVNARTVFYPRPRMSTGIPAGTNKRLSISPSPLTPRSYRRTSAGLRGRKSTSSSISSIRSIHQHHPSHSKASSTSSASLASPSASMSTKTPVRSPHSSVKVLPATPTTSSFPTNIRVVRASSNDTSAFGMVPPQSPGLLFARRKRSPFKGPVLHLGGSHPTPHNRGRRGSGGGSRSGSRQGRRSGEIIEEEEEELEELGEDGEDVITEGEIEEVDAFSPLDPAKGETLVSLKDG